MGLLNPRDWAFTKEVCLVNVDTLPSNALLTSPPSVLACPPGALTHAPKPWAAPQVGERVSMVCAPSRPTVRRRGAGPLSAAPPFTRPGQPLAATNHALGREFALLQPPAPTSGKPGWLLPAVILLASSDAATGVCLLTLTAEWLYSTQEGSGQVRLCKLVSKWSGSLTPWRA